MTSSQLPQEHYLQVEEVYQSFVEQIQKDASMANIHLSDHIFASPQLNAIIQSLTQVLKELLNSPQGMEKIQTWLYRVDVSEGSIKKSYNNLMLTTQLLRQNLLSNAVYKKL